MSGGWTIEAWKAAWGDNLPMVVNDGEIPLPPLRDGYTWLIAREITSSRADHYPTYCLFLQRHTETATELIRHGRIDKHMYGERGVQELAAEFAKEIA